MFLPASAIQHNILSSARIVHVRVQCARLWGLRFSPLPWDSASQPRLPLPKPGSLGSGLGLGFRAVETGAQHSAPVSSPPGQSCIRVNIPSLASNVRDSGGWAFHRSPRTPPSAAGGFVSSRWGNPASKSHSILCAQRVQLWRPCFSQLPWDSTSQPHLPLFEPGSPGSDLELGFSAVGSGVQHNSELLSPSR